MSIYKKLAKIQQELKAPKGQYNSFGKYHYRSCEDILEAVKPHLGEMSLILVDEPRLVGDRFYIEATATLSDGDQHISVSAYAREPDSKKGMDAAQLTGATSSYARKYALSGLFCLDDSKDADHVTDAVKPARANTQPKQSQPAQGTDRTESGQDKNSPITQKQIARLMTIAKGLELDDLKDIVCGEFGYQSRKDILVKDYEEICDRVAQVTKNHIGV